MLTPNGGEARRELLRTSLRRYDRAAESASHRVILSYSTSFSLATKLLSREMRSDIRNLYAVVRIADEIVDGTAAAAGFTSSQIGALLDQYEQDVREAAAVRFHADPVLHAYAETARRCHFDDAHIEAFFASMRRDLQQRAHDDASFNDYIYGSAEVIGLLCLSIFLKGQAVPPERRATMEQGACALGAAFQKINFLRDLAEDRDGLGRTYFPGTGGEGMTEALKAQLVAEIRQDLIDARAVVGWLPLRARAGVLAAMGLFAELNERIDAVETSELLRRRVRVPGWVKGVIAVKAVITAPLCRVCRAGRVKGTKEVGING